MKETLERIAASVEGRIKALFAELGQGPRDGLFAVPAPEPLLRRVEELTLRGGKRLRAALLVEAAACFDRDAERNPAALDAACALELLHSYFLIHDDIMDGDEIRRGGPTMQVDLARAVGDDKLGVGLGILAGDLAAALHERLIAGLALPEPRRQDVARIFAAMHLEVVHGQTLDMMGGAPPEEVGSRKTASYTTVGPLLAGAAVVGAGDAEARRLSEFGRCVGVAFQHRDDLLGCFGRPEITGKSAGNDLTTGKPTFLVAEALRRASEPEERAIRAALGNAGADERTVQAARDAIESSGGRAACEARIGELIAEAVRILGPAPYLEDGKRFLLDVAGFMGSRDA
ncbi:MAG: polyprenyl synthetase family protein [Deltaproteobacteria bacterium]|nr:polyprenyl synthetase family protein [Deltaproteobacteria bacterium]